MKIKLEKKLSYEGRDLSEIDLNLEKLTGKDILFAERECIATGTPIAGMAETNKTFLAALTAKAASLDIEAIGSLSARDFSRLTIETQSFLLDGD